jgi:hypothetical protein
MIKGLEAFNRILGNDYFNVIISSRINGKRQYANDVAIVKKELEALDIIKKKDVHKTMLSFTQSADEYNHFIDDVSEELQLTQEEYDLLKEVLL